MCQIRCNVHYSITIPLTKGKMKPPYIYYFQRDAHFNGSNTEGTF
uniref:Uncharacterized protein n=1 Tax=Zea mays TaxID=4577 RepID=B7ZZ90_MAIZE|nr:unknown [Zea mays]